MGSKTSKCNIFNKLVNKTGTFYTFSQYTQDLTHQQHNIGSYRCIPSKFVVLELDNLYDAVYKENRLPTYLQNYFENACTVYRQEANEAWNTKVGFDSDSSVSSVHVSNVLLWRMLKEYGFVSIEEEDGNKICKNIKHIGNIDITSYKEAESINNYDGIGYNEIYCHISNSVNLRKYQMGSVSSLSTKLTAGISYNDYYISGFSESPTGLDVTTITDSLYLYQLGIGSGGVPSDMCPIELIKNSETDSTVYYRNDSESESFNFNTIIVYYDILNETDNGDEVVYESIPMGLYIVGVPQADGTVTNSVTKYTSINSTGTSYAARIMTRFLTTPSSVTITDSVSSNTSNDESLCRLMSLMAENLVLMREITNQNLNNNQKILDHLSTFRNNKTNVPYIRSVGGENYWFVNGKNTGVKC